MRRAICPTGAVEVIADQTPFYGESGGQIGDTGTHRRRAASTVEVVDTLKTPGGADRPPRARGRGHGRGWATRARSPSTTTRRDAIRANHSATHLLHLALKEVLGDHVAQKGSLVAPDRLRFDFAHFAPMTDEEKRKVEDLVNDEIRSNADSVIEVMSLRRGQAARARWRCSARSTATRCA